MIHENSIQAFRENFKDGTALSCKEKVIAAVEQFQPITRREIKDVTGLEYSTVSGTVTGLINDEVIEESGDKVSKETNKTVAVLRMRGKTTQKAWEF